MNETDKAYLAGLIDGEGTVSIVRLYSKATGLTHYVASVEVSNTNFLMVEWIMKRVGGSVVVTKRPERENQKPVYRVGLRNKLAENVLRKVLPYLVLKPKQAVLVLELRDRIRKNADRSKLPESERAYRAHLHEECRKLNVRGMGDAERLSERTPEREMRQSELAGTEPREGEPKSLPADA